MGSPHTKPWKEAKLSPKGNMERGKPLQTQKNPKKTDNIVKILENDQNINRITITRKR